jgi:hypothetical protein
MPRTPATSLAARLLNVFAMPGAVFEEVKATPPNPANWLVPGLLFCLVSAIGAVLLFSQSAIHQKLRAQVDKQAATYERLVQERKMTRAAADSAMALGRRITSPSVLKAFGVVMSVIFGFARVFWWATVLWLLGLWFLRVRFRYGKTLEIAGLAGLIGTLGTVVTLLLQINLGQPAVSPDLAQSASGEAGQPINQGVLAAIAIFDLWQAGVFAVALARLAGVPFFRGAFVMFAFWVLFQFVKMMFATSALHLAG